VTSCVSIGEMIRDSGVRKRCGYHAPRTYLKIIFLVVKDILFLI